MPHKNIRNFLGETLLGRAVKVAMETCDAVVVTTDSQDYAILAMDAALAAAKGRDEGLPVLKVDIHMRPPELATDEATTIAVVRDAIWGREADVIVLLQPTMPMRTGEQVRQALALLDDEADSVVSVRRVPQAYAPDRVLIMVGDELSAATIEGRTCTRRQDARPAYIRDGTVYVTRRAWVDANSLYGACTRALLLDGEAHSIDTEEDFRRLESEAIRRDVLLGDGSSPVAWGPVGWDGRAL